ncbi:transposase [Rhizobium sp. RHZ02]|uniref:transposase n=1 Tax=Rhizobium sp. RHZ02 TaxID=2769306 RepID=UPI00391B01F4
MDDRKIVSGTILVIRNGLRRCDAPKEYGACTMLYNRFIRWSRLGVFSLALISKS